jgi:hypothetical protein
VDECKPLAHGAVRRLRRQEAALPQGRVVQVDPIKPEMKPPGTKRSKLVYHTLLSGFAFNFNLRRYIKRGESLVVRGWRYPVPAICQSGESVDWFRAGTYTGSLFSST